MARAGRWFGMVGRGAVSRIVPERGTGPPAGGVRHCTFGQGRNGPKRRCAGAAPRLFYVGRLVNGDHLGRQPAAPTRTGHGRGSTMNPYALEKMLEYTRQELARSRGHRRWVTFFQR